METGACDGAIPLFAALAAEHPGTELAGAALFDIGLCHERLGDLDAALAAYDELVRGHHRTEAWRDGLYRRGLVAQESGRPADALRDFRRLRRLREAATPREEAVLGLQIGACQQALEHPRAAVDEVVPALEVLEGLDDADDPDLGWYRAQAHVMLGDVLADALADISLDTLDVGQQRERLQRMLELFGDAADHYRAAGGGPGGPLWTCAAGVRLGELHEGFAATVRASPTPEALDDGQVELYLAELGRITDSYVAQAEALYQETLDFAATAHIDNRWVERARENLERLRAAR